MSVELRPMRLEDVDAVTSVHVAAFPGFFLSFLGRRFLRELYCAIVADPGGIAFVAVDGEMILGFVAGTSNGGFYRRAARGRWLRFALASIGAFVRRPAILPRLLRALYAPPSISREGAVLMSLAVDPGAQRGGMGTSLTEAFVDGARQRGASAVLLSTDKTGNDRVNAFYQAQGFALSAAYVTPEGRAMNEYILYI